MYGGSLTAVPAVESSYIYGDRLDRGWCTIGIGSVFYVNILINGPLRIGANGDSINKAEVEEKGRGKRRKMHSSIQEVIVFLQ